MRSIYLLFTVLFLFPLSACGGQADEPTPAAPTPSPTPTDENSLPAVAPEDIGWSAEKLAQVERFAAGIGSAAVMALYDGQVFFSWGDVTTNYPVHSIRKPFLGALYGIHVNNGDIDLDATLAELDINDIAPRLTEAERQATVRDLLKSRSGVYHEAAGEVPEMEAMRPERGSHPPDSHYYYNNWDFNALGTIFEQETGTKIFEEFEKQIAGPIGMQDFTSRNGQYNHEYNKSIHPVYAFNMSARDMARFGQLYLQDGLWEGEQIIPGEWIKESTSAYSEMEELPGISYGYLWNVIPEGVEGTENVGPLYFHTGLGIHLLMVIPEAKLVIVHRLDTREAFVQPGEGLAALVNMILEAGPSGEMAAEEEVQSLDRTVKIFEGQVEEYRKSLNIPGLSTAIVKDGRILSARGYGFADLENEIPATENTPYHIASLTKPFAAALVMQLVEDGRLALDDEIGDILEDTSFSYPEGTLAGYAELCEGFKAIGEDSTGPYANFRVLFQDYRCDSEAITVAHHLSHTSQGRPGEYYLYNGLLYGLLTEVVEEVSGLDFEDLLVKKIIAPLEMKDTYPNESAQRGRQILEQRALPYRLDGDGRPVESVFPEGLNAAAGMVSTVSDLAKFSRALDEDLIVSLESKEQMFEPAISITDKLLPYGLGWFVQEYEGQKLVWHYGHQPEAYSSLILKVPEENLAFILLANSDAASASFNLGDGDVLKSPFARLFLNLFPIDK